MCSVTFFLFFSGVASTSQGNADGNSGERSSEVATITVPAKRRRQTSGNRQKGSGNAASSIPEKTNTGNEQGDVPTNTSTKGQKKRDKSFLSKLPVGSVVDAPDGTKWRVIQTNESSAGRRGQQNVLKDVPGPSPYAKRHVTDGIATSSWRLLIDDGMLKHIKKCTELEAKRVLQPKNWSVSLTELDAFLGILYLRGATESKGMDIHLMWSQKYGFPFCKEAMSRDRFTEIMRFLRFDEKSSRAERLKTDKFACFSEVFYRFIANCQSNYVPGPLISVDEQLFPSKARCPFTQFMASKPDKYGQKYWMAVDKDSKYVINAFPYLGKNEARPSDERLGDFVVKELVKPYLNKGRNVTCDNFFTSLHLAENLKSKKTSLVGTVNKARREIPGCMKNAREELHSTKAFAKDDITLTVYRGKTNKNVIVMSSMHPDVTIEKGVKSKPETVSFYNLSKYGVDVVDQMARKFSVKASSRRWPVHSWYNVLDLAGINAWILYKTLTKEKISRRDFLLKLGEELIKANTESRRGVPEADDVNLPVSAGQRRRCQVKIGCKEGKTTYNCNTCHKTVCKKCTGGVSYICLSCKPDSDEDM